MLSSSRRCNVFASSHGLRPEEEAADLKRSGHPAEDASIQLPIREGGNKQRIVLLHDKTLTAVSRFLFGSESGRRMVYSGPREKVAVREAEPAPDVERELSMGI